MKNSAAAVLAAVIVAALAGSRLALTPSLTMLAQETAALEFWRLAGSKECNVSCSRASPSLAALLSTPGGGRQGRRGEVRNS